MSSKAKSISWDSPFKWRKIAQRSRFSSLDAAPPTPRPDEMMRIGPLFVNTSILDDILNEKKRELLENKEVIEFLRRRKLVQQDWGWIHCYADPDPDPGGQKKTTKEAGTPRYQGDHWLPATTEACSTRLRLNFTVSNPDLYCIRIHPHPDKNNPQKKREIRENKEVIDFLRRRKLVQQVWGWIHCFESGSGLDPDSCGSGSGSRRTEITHKRSGNSSRTRRSLTSCNVGSLFNKTKVEFTVSNPDLDWIRIHADPDPGGQK
jgi:hypothetical protein